MRRRLIELKSQRTTLLENAEALLKEGKQAEYLSLIHISEPTRH